MKSEPVVKDGPVGLVLQVGGLPKSAAPTPRPTVEGRPVALIGFKPSIHNRTRSTFVASVNPSGDYLK